MCYFLRDLSYVSEFFDQAVITGVAIKESNRLIFPVQVRFGFNSGCKFRFSSD